VVHKRATAAVRSTKRKAKVTLTREPQISEGTGDDMQRGCSAMSNASSNARVLSPSVSVTMTLEEEQGESDEAEDADVHTEPESSSSAVKQADLQVP
jgi:hypothetical protein